MFWDVFRPPTSQMEKMLFAAFLGTGTQMLVLTVAVLLLSLVGMFYPGNRGTLVMTIIVVYCFTSGIAGHVSGKFYIQSNQFWISWDHSEPFWVGGKNWASNAVTSLTKSIFFHWKDTSMDNLMFMATPGLRHFPHQIIEFLCGQPIWFRFWYAWKIVFFLVCWNRKSGSRTTRTEIFSALFW